MTKIWFDIAHAYKAESGKTETILSVVAHPDYEQSASTHCNIVKSIIARANDKHTLTDEWGRKYIAETTHAATGAPRFLVMGVDIIDTERKNVVIANICDEKHIDLVSDILSKAYLNEQAIAQDKAPVA